MGCHEELAQNAESYHTGSCLFLGSVIAPYSVFYLMSFRVVYVLCEKLKCGSVYLGKLQKCHSGKITNTYCLDVCFILSQYALNRLCLEAHSWCSGIAYISYDIGVGDSYGLFMVRRCVLTIKYNVLTGASP